MKLVRPAAALAAWCLGAPWGAAALAAPPQVVASIKPIHSLAAAVMEGVAAPRLLVSGSASPHTYALKPSDARALARAWLIVWVGEGLEPFMEKAVAALGKRARALKLSRAPGIALLDAREGGVWEGHGNDEKEKDRGQGQKKEAAGKRERHEEKDMHIWLSPAIAKQIARAVAQALAEVDAANAPAYRANLARLLAKIDSLDGELRERLRAATGKPYIVFHDAYQYFERHYGLSPAGAISVTAAHAPGARRLYEIRKKIAESRAGCAFREPQFGPALVRAAVSGTPAKVGVLDPLGMEAEEGPEAYFQLMRGLAESLRACLAPGH